MRILVLSTVALTTIVGCGSKKNEAADAQTVKPVVVTKTVTVKPTVQTSAQAKNARLVQIGENKVRMAKYDALMSELDQSYFSNPNAGLKDIAMARVRLEQLYILNRELQTSPLLDEASKRSLLSSMIKLDMWKAAIDQSL